MADRKTCGACDAVLGPANKSGYCRKHFSSHGLAPDHGERISAGFRKRFEEDEEFRRACRARATKARWLPQSVEARKRSCRERKLWEVGQRSITPEARKRAGESFTETVLGWCPPDLRDEYRHLIYTHKGKAEARRIIMEKVEQREMARLLNYIEDAARFVSVNDRCPVMRAGDAWRYGMAIKSAEQIVAMARRKGWAPMELAA